MGDQLISLGVAMLGLAGIYMLIRPVTGATLLGRPEQPQVHDAAGQGSAGDSAKAVGHLGE